MQVGRKSYFLEFVKTHKSGAYALSSPSRTTSLLAPSKSNGPIARDLREKHDSLSLENPHFPFCKKSLAFTFLSLIFEGDEALFPILSLCDLKSNPIIPIMSLFLRFDIRHYLDRPFSSFLYSYHLWYMSTCYLCLSSFENRFTAPEPRCLEKRADSDYLRKLRNFTC